MKKFLELNKVEVSGCNVGSFYTSRGFDGVELALCQSPRPNTTK